MTLILLMAPDPSQGTVILADPAGGADLDRLVAGLTAALGDVRPLLFPLPDETTRRHETPAALARSRHADLWFGLSSDERSRVVLAAGPSTAYLAPVVEPDPLTIVAVRDPDDPRTPAGAWRAVLGAFGELDEVPDAPASSAERKRWLERVSAAARQFRLLRATDPALIAGEVATAVGLGPQRAVRAARLASANGPSRRIKARRDRPVHWLDQELYALSAPPAPLPARKRGDG